jgi:carbon storage regulator CsrA
MALVITRRDGQAFYIGDDIKITILDGCAQTRIAISAPKDKIILREELCSLEDYEKKESCIQAKKL